MVYVVPAMKYAEESPIDDQQSVMEEVRVMKGSQVEDAGVIGSGRQTFVDMGTTILTMRSYVTDKPTSIDEGSQEQKRPASLQECEIFQPIQPKVRWSVSVVVYAAIVSLLFLCVAEPRSNEDRNGATLGPGYTNDH